MSFLSELNNLSDTSDFSKIQQNALDALRTAQQNNSLQNIVNELENTLRDHRALRLRLWTLIDFMCKKSRYFKEALQPRLMDLVCGYPVGSQEGGFSGFVTLLNGWRMMFSGELVAHIKNKLGISDSGALVRYDSELKTLGAFSTKQVSLQKRTGEQATLMVRTRDSVMATAQTNAYAPAKPIDIPISLPAPAPDATAGYRRPPPANEAALYREERRRALKTAREQDDARHQKARVEPVKRAAKVAIDDFSDVIMPDELPRDNYGIKIGNFPQGVRFIRNAIRTCGGAIELSVLEQRISTMFDGNRFGDIRFFIQLHSPTFEIVTEKNTVIVRLREDKGPPPTTKFNGIEYFSWECTTCPLCSKVLKGRNLAAHTNSPSCIRHQCNKIEKLREMSPAELPLSTDMSPITALAKCAMDLRARLKEARLHNVPITSGAVFDDDDLDEFSERLRCAAAVRRFKDSSTGYFTNIVLFAVRIVRARFLAIHKVKEMRDAIIGPGDGAFIRFFGTLGALIHRLPIPWIELGDVCDMCYRFSNGVLPAFNPPPRPAHPIGVENEYPGILFCESEIEVSDNEVLSENEFSDDEQEQFVFAPPVSLTESIMCAGFERDTEALKYRLRTQAPIPMSVPKALTKGLRL